MPHMRARATVVTKRDGKSVTVAPGEVFDFTNEEVTDLARRAPRHLSALKPTPRHQDSLPALRTGPSVSGDKNTASIKPGANVADEDDASDL